MNKLSFNRQWVDDDDKVSCANIDFESLPIKGEQVELYDDPYCYRGTVMDVQKEYSTVFVKWKTVKRINR